MNDKRDNIDLIGELSDKDTMRSQLSKFPRIFQIRYQVQSQEGLGKSHNG